MPDLDPADVTQMLHAMQAGDRNAVNQLFPIIYEALHERAHYQRQKWHGDFTLNTTALAHEAFLKLADQQQADYTSRVHFLSVAAKAMRHILVDYARKRRAEKRGGDVEKQSLENMGMEPEGMITMTEARADEVLALEAALERLAQYSPREAQVVECRFFVGMSVKETAAALGVGERTIKRDWAMAKTWLYREMRSDEGD